MILKRLYLYFRERRIRAMLARIKKHTIASEAINALPRRRARA